ncbi:hypothetical protein OR1_02503 [Geobacter sp. OR-1]|uniref:hypothetical protein n=1 Tax=Geobacter sp. OR-1 TaxID=1266765 RepID=UPI0005426B54|nr:hypothetical protein [Geobacter sp. OR-1]GAM10215.1 hypothetical protein OR1_02503 [Geobacter sp. OR-1]
MKMSARLIAVVCLMLVFSSRMAQASDGALEGLLTNKMYWNNFSWVDVFISKIFKLGKWEKTGKSSEKYTTLYSGKVNIENMTFDIYIDELNDNTNKNHSIRLIRETTNEEDFGKIRTLLENRFGTDFTKYDKSETVSSDILIMLSERQWQLDNSIIDATITGITDNTKSTSYSMALTYKNRQKTNAKDSLNILQCNINDIFWDGLVYDTSNNIYLIDENANMIKNMYFNKYSFDNIRITDANFHLVKEMADEEKKIEFDIVKSNGSLKGKISNDVLTTVVEGNCSSLRPNTNQ